MTRPYSQDLRERIVRAVEGGLSRHAAAVRFAVSVSFVVKLMQRWQRRGTLAPDQYGGWKKPRLLPYRARIHALIVEQCDITLDELRGALAVEGILVARSTLADFLAAEGLTRKKRRNTPPSRSVPT
jgi:putative transposase